MRILITGGAGYIGSHIVKKLIEDTDYIIYIIDNLSTSSKKNINTLFEIAKLRNKENKIFFIKVDLNQTKKIKKIFEVYKFDIIIHLAASTSVQESIKKPLKYYKNNTLATENLINNALLKNINNVIFSSTAAVYGNPVNMLSLSVSEKDRPNPINPYGISKLMAEQIIQNNAINNSKFKYVIFRYFNVAGADIHYINNNLSPRLGSTNLTSKNLLKIASECAIGKRKKISVFGDDYNTFDGTAIRDFVHVDDIANAHIRAIEYLKDNKKSRIFNIGYGKGYSVKKIINIVKNISKSDFEVKIKSKRNGDIENIIANNEKISKYLNWRPKYDNIELICKSIIEWEKLIDKNKTFIVNLQADKKRKIHMEKICTKLNLNFEFIKAVNGKNLKNIDYYISFSRNKVTQGLKRELVPGEIGCILSHQNIYKKVINNKLEYALILEDDVDISDDIHIAFDNVKNLPIDWDIFFIGYHGKLNEDLQIEGKHIYQINSKYSVSKLSQKPYGTYGYIVSYKGAKKLLSKSNTFELPMDWYTGDLTLNSYAIDRQLIFINKKLSDISNLVEERIKMRERFK